MWFCPTCESAFLKPPKVSPLTLAAPEMLAALKEAENVLMDYIPTIERGGASLNFGRTVLAEIRATIAKAEGR
jgi:hypothetical protein